MQVIHTRDGQNNGNTGQYRNKRVSYGCTERTLVAIMFHYSFVCLHCTSVNVFVFSNSLYESSTKWETCQVFKEDRLLVHI